MSLPSGFYYICSQTPFMKSFELLSLNSCSKEESEVVAGYLFWSMYVTLSLWGFIFFPLCSEEVGGGGSGRREHLHPGLPESQVLLNRETFACVLYSKFLLYNRYLIYYLLHFGSLVLHAPVGRNPRSRSAICLFLQWSWTTPNPTT